ncbi:replication protein A 70 kDa DNA-binding subunit-like [Neltuma alba]|uniref:replication protein A 70 kDa DNA-binding subunit-like n=1 Tax=Neltuma alba TaxID=207710 RepID=UPI0010A54289|nr:replication protein A 70 kDa DNA-binding subunit-like [Prosopis alba]
MRSEKGFRIQSRSQSRKVKSLFFSVLRDGEQHHHSMASTNRDMIKDINNSKETWTIVARVLRKWVSYKKAPPYAPWRIGMLLVDEQGSRIKGFATQKGLIERYKNDLKEGRVYHCENFQIVGNDNKYKVTSHSWRLKFHNTTYFEELDLPIPKESFNFIPIKDIAEYTAKNEGFIDVIGFLQAFGDLKDFKNTFGTSKTITLTLSNQYESAIKVVLFGNCAVNTYNSKPQGSKHPIIVMVRFGRLNNQQAYGHISNVFEATKVLFNPNIPEAHDLLQSLDEIPEGRQHFSQLSSADYQVVDNESMLTFPIRIHVAELSTITEPCEVVTKVCIQKIEIAYGWTYDGCSCDRKPVYENDKLKCKSYTNDVLTIEPKFKLHYTVFDSTGICSIIFFNRLACDLIGFSAEQLKTKVAKDKNPGSFPKELSNCMGKEMIVKLKIKESNIRYRNSSMGVIQFSTDKKMLENFTYSAIKGSQPNESENITHEKATVDTSSSQPTTLLSCGMLDVDNDLLRSQLHGSLNTLSKRKKNPLDSSIDDDETRLSANTTTKSSYVKPLKNIKKEKEDKD